MDATVGVAAIAISHLRRSPIADLGRFMDNGQEASHGNCQKRGRQAG
jgi:hypothetical protein